MISIPENLVERIQNLESGVLCGVYDPQSRRGSIIALQDGPNAMLRYAPLARLDRVDEHLPLRVVRHGDGIEVYDSTDLVLDVNVYPADGFSARNPLDPAVQAFLETRRVVVVGQGSLGSEVTVALAQQGIGEVVGLDPDDLEIHNCSRHALSTAFLGQPKTRGMASFFEVNCPRSNYVGISEDLFRGDRSRLKAMLDTFEPDLIVATTDRVEIQLEAQVAALYARCNYAALGCLEQAIEGEVFIRIAGSTTRENDTEFSHSCYGDLRPPGKTLKASSVFDYSGESAGRMVGEPALGTLIKHKALFSALILQDLLLLESAYAQSASADTRKHISRGAQYIRIGGPVPMERDGQAMQIQKPWEVRWGRVSRNPNCRFCGPLANPAKQLFNQDLSAVEEDAEWMETRL